MNIDQVCDELGIKLASQEKKMNIRPLLKLVCNRFMGSWNGLIEMLVDHVSSPANHAKIKTDHIYAGPGDNIMAEDMANCDPDVSSSLHLLLPSISLLSVTYMIAKDFVSVSMQSFKYQNLSNNICGFPI